MADTENKTVTVHIDKDQGYGGSVTAAVNGMVVEVPTGADTEVSAEIAEALANSHVRYTVVKPAGDTKDGSGSGVGSEPSTTIESGTAIRDHADMDGGAGANAKPTDTPPTLNGEPEPISLADVKVILPPGAGVAEPSEAEATAPPAPDANEKQSAPKPAEAKAKPAK